MQGSTAEVTHTPRRSQIEVEMHCIYTNTHIWSTKPSVCAIYVHARVRWGACGCEIAPPIVHSNLSLGRSTGETFCIFLQFYVSFVLIITTKQHTPSAGGMAVEWRRNSCFA